MPVESVETALRSAEAEVSDQTLSNAVRLKPGQILILRLRLLTVKEFKTADAKIAPSVELISRESLLEEGGSCILIAVGSIVGCAKAQLPLCGNRRDRVVRSEQNRWLR